MKTSRLILLLGLLPILGSCDFFAAGVFCSPRHVTVTTKDGSETKAASLKVKPGQISIKQGCPFEIRFSAGIKVETTSAEAWLRQAATDVSPIVLTVPMAQGKTTYKYDIEVVGFGRLDPRARVK